MPEQHFSPPDVSQLLSLLHAPTRKLRPLLESGSHTPPGHSPGRLLHNLPRSVPPTHVFVFGATTRTGPVSASVGTRALLISVDDQSHGGGDGVESLSS